MRTGTVPITADNEWSQREARRRPPAINLRGAQSATSMRAPSRSLSPVNPAVRVQQIIRLRRMRERYFGADLFADPVWDMLLDLMAAHLEGKCVTVTSVCAAAAVPSATAQRRLKALTSKGLVVRTGDPDNRRRIYLSLSKEAQHAMVELLGYLDGRGRNGSAGGTQGGLQQFEKKSGGHDNRH
jgi:DNA-binding MarR family transcriptional regulator